MSRLIIGIDFGTVATGAAFTLANPEREQVTSLGRNDTVITVTPPAFRFLVTDEAISKFPSELCNTGTDMKWGFEAKEEARGVKMKFMKLAFCGYSELEKVDQSSRALSSSLGTHVPIGLTPATLIEVYLRFLHNYIMESVASRKPQGFSTLTRHYCFTVPVAWTDDQKNGFLAIARAAGITSDNATMECIQEPHAALLYFLSSPRYTIPEGDCIIIADCGGGTFDLASYKRLKDGKSSRIRVESISQSGSLCGSIFVNQAIRELVSARIGEERLQRLTIQSHADLFRVLDQEFEDLKRAFNGHAWPDSWQIQIGQDITIPAANIIGGILTITRDDMVHAFSEPLNLIKALVKEQVEVVEKKGKRVTSVFLLGGFGASIYVANQLQTFLAASYNGRIRLVQMQYNGQAVACGAVHHGIGNITVSHT
ncbi:hypothetical protein L211DRAFT_871568 [Terfezia boudieri ATCC MYA-4762]|uniref:Actin-like ATPase domain-containing protein n=1 Tax=Terfezia boudieri ATCC MYA-4762 TaxID=1051890 RepID=A0A3N4LAU7_9PEZI|nr:hypothetical protein L211DRAFT_871568 [Terfezia boudieri ATCC MYA-4762]